MLTDAPDSDSGWTGDEAREVAADPSLPPGTVAFQDSDGLWWQYPLAEFEER